MCTAFQQQLLMVVVSLIVADSFNCLANITGTDPPIGRCICGLNDGLKVVNDTGCGRFVRRLTTGQCYRFAGIKETCRSRGQASIIVEVFLVDDGHQNVGWVRGDQVVMGDVERTCQAAGPSNGIIIGMSGQTVEHCPRIVTRAEWGARPPKSVENITQPVPREFIHHTEGRSCTDQTGCSAVVRSIQNFHMDDRGWDDIGYNFLVGEDGNAYEGRGWDRVGAQVRGYNSVSLGFSVMGSYSEHLPNEAALTAVKGLISCGVEKGKLAANYTLHGHRDAGQTECPGQKLYELIQTWPHYAGPITGSPRRRQSTQPVQSNNRL